MGKTKRPKIEPPPVIDRQPDQLPQLYEHCVAYARRHHDWYRKSGGRARVRSVTLRLLSLAALAGGAVWTALHGSAKPSGGPGGSVTLVADALGLGALAVGGAALIADRVLAGSASWVREMSAAMAIDARIELFRIDFERAIAAAAPDARAPAALAEARAFVEAINAIVLAETAAWGAETRQVLAELWRLAAPRKAPPET